MMKLLSDLCGTLKKNECQRWEAQELMSPSFRGRELRRQYQSAVVTILLCQHQSKIVFPLIKRVVDGQAHSGQMALPGGKVEKGEGLAQAAIRELCEEIGVDPGGIELQRSLTPLKVPVSGYRVHPFIMSYGHSKLCWKPQLREVEKVFTVSLDHFLDDSIIKKTTTTQNGIPANTPYYQLEGQIVWGATAMILSEFRQLLLLR